MYSVRRRDFCNCDLNNCECCVDLREIGKDDSNFSVLSIIYTLNEINTLNDYCIRRNYYVLQHIQEFHSAADKDTSFFVVPITYSDVFGDRTKEKVVGMMRKCDRAGLAICADEFTLNIIEKTVCMFNNCNSNIYDYIQDLNKFFNNICSENDNCMNDDTDEKTEFNIKTYFNLAKSIFGTGTFNYDKKFLVDVDDSLVMFSHKKYMKYLSTNHRDYPNRDDFGCLKYILNILEPECMDDGTMTEPSILMQIASPKKSVYKDKNGKYCLYLDFTISLSCGKLKKDEFSDFVSYGMSDEVNPKSNLEYNPLGLLRAASREVREETGLVVQKVEDCKRGWGNQTTAKTHFTAVAFENTTYCFYCDKGYWVKDLNNTLKRTKSESEVEAKKKSNSYLESKICVKCLKQLADTKVGSDSIIRSSSAPVSGVSYASRARANSNNYYAIKKLKDKSVVEEENKEAVLNEENVIGRVRDSAGESSNKRRKIWRK
jgi:hypothetical protein